MLIYSLCINIGNIEAETCNIWKWHLKMASIDISMMPCLACMLTWKVCWCLQIIQALSQSRYHVITNKVLIWWQISSSFGGKSRIGISFNRICLVHWHNIMARQYQVCPKAQNEMSHSTWYILNAWQAPVLKQHWYSYIASHCRAWSQGKLSAKLCVLWSPCFRLWSINLHCMQRTSWLVEAWCPPSAPSKNHLRACISEVHSLLHQVLGWASQPVQWHCHYEWWILSCIFFVLLYMMQDPYKAATSGEP